MELRVVLLIHMLGFCWGLRDVRIQVPAAVKKGDSATLYCWYDTEGENLYSVQWYKDKREFFRYAPRQIPAIKTFPVGDLRVNEARSNGTQVTLLNLNSDAADRYSCEVSADAPSFHTIVVYGDMTIVDSPIEIPTVIGMQPRYKIGDSVKVICRSGSSKPATNLTWFINDRPPRGERVLMLSPLETDESERQATQIGLQFIVNEDHFSHGKLKIRCSASIYKLYWQSSEVSAEEDRSNRYLPNLVPISTATRYGDSYDQPPPNHQTGQKKPDGQVDVKILGSSAIGLNSSFQFILGLLICLRLIVN